MPSLRLNATRWLIVLAGLLASNAGAHWADLAVAEISSLKDTVRVTLTYPTGLTAFADTDGNGSLSAQEIAGHETQLEAALGAKITVSSNTGSSGAEQGRVAVRPALTDIPLPEGVSSQTHTTLTLVYRFSIPPASYRVHYGLFVPGVSTASCVATVRHGFEIQSAVFTPENRDFSSSSSAAPQAPVDFKGFVLLGIGHILSGYDHLLFLLALLALGGGLKYVLKVVTAFTLAHSVTLALTTLNLIHLPARFVESGIALSIAFVALENLLRRREAAKLERGRWVVTFLFGLLHGMGFASILRELNLPAANLPVALVGFNLGVELGQLSAVLPAFALLKLLERVKFSLPIQLAASGVAAVAGVYWFVERAFLGA